MNVEHAVREVAKRIKPEAGNTLERLFARAIGLLDTVEVLAQLHYRDSISWIACSAADRTSGSVSFSNNVVSGERNVVSPISPS